MLPHLNTKRFFLLPSAGTIVCLARLRSRRKWGIYAEIWRVFLILMSHHSFWYTSAEIERLYWDGYIQNELVKSDAWHSFRFVGAVPYYIAWTSQRRRRVAEEIQNVVYRQCGPENRGIFKCWCNTAVRKVGKRALPIVYKRARIRNQTEIRRKWLSLRCFTQQHSKAALIKHCGVQTVELYTRMETKRQTKNDTCVIRL